jgi:hypothetical protein
VEEGLRLADLMTRPLVTWLALFLLGGLGCSNKKSEPAATATSTDASADAGPQRGQIECLTIEAPPGSTKAAGVGGGLAFHGAKQLRSGTVSYDPSFTVTTQAAEGANVNAVRDELMESFRTDYAAVMRTASRTGGFQASDLQPPRVTSSPVAGLPGHAWQIDSVASFNGERLPWRAFSMTTVFRDRVYVVTAAAALSNIGEMKPIADRYFSSIRFDACK